MKTTIFFKIAHYKVLFSSQLGHNIFTNYLAVIWMGGLSIVLIPFYLKRLGQDQWGIVAICMALQAFFSLMDAGLAQIMPRDIARLAHDSAARLKIYIVYQRSYFFLGVCGFILGQAAVPWLVNHWFGGGRAFTEQDSWAFHLVIVQFLFQFSNNANIGYWNGMQMQALANFRQCIFGSLKHIGALSLICFWHTDAIAYLIPFALLSTLEFLLNTYTISNYFHESAHQPIYWKDYKKLANEAGVLFIGVLIGMLSSQMDRIVLSKYVDIAAFGIYVIVANLGLAVMQLQHPLVKAFLPRLTHDVVADSKSSFKRLAWGLSLLCILPCLILALFTPWILRVWIGDPEVVLQGALPLSFFFCAVAFNAIYQLAYQQVLVSGNGKWVVKTNIFIFVVIFPLILYAAPALGILSGAIYWLSMTFLQSILGLIWLRFKANTTNKN